MRQKICLKGFWNRTPAGVAHFLEHKMFDTEDGNALSDLSSNALRRMSLFQFGHNAYHFECTVNFG
jgi:predicted Zn-dependent peptidase